jgi:hypothetical protein
LETWVGGRFYEIHEDGTLITLTPGGGEFCRPEVHADRTAYEREWMKVLTPYLQMAKHPDEKQIQHIWFP